MESGTAQQPGKCSSFRLRLPWADPDPPLTQPGSGRRPLLGSVGAWERRRGGASPKARKLCTEERRQEPNTIRKMEELQLLSAFLGQTLCICEKQLQLCYYIRDTEGAVYKIYFNKYIKKTNTFQEIIKSRRPLRGHCCSSGNENSKEVY